jgi:thermostable 8-oxoguanine DNA glycosylase
MAFVGFESSTVNAARDVFEYFGREGIRCVRKIKSVTEKAFNLAKGDRIEDSIRELCELHGVKPRVASAILTFYDPQRFGVMDKLAWKSLYGEDKEEFSPKDYVKYLEDIRQLAKQYNLSPRGIDLALWHLTRSKQIRK